MKDTIQVRFENLFQGEEQNAIERMMNSETDYIQDNINVSDKQIKEHVKYMNDTFSFKLFRQYISKIVFESFEKYYRIYTGVKESLDCKYVGFEDLANGNSHFVVSMTESHFKKWLEIARSIKSGCTEDEVFFVIAKGIGMHSDICDDVNEQLPMTEIEKFLVGGWNAYDKKLTEIYGDYQK